MSFILFLILALPGIAPAAEEPPAAGTDLTAIHDRFISAVESSKRDAVLDEMARTPPATLRELKALFDIFMRFPEKPVREAALSSLRRIDADRGNLESGLIAYLQLPEDEAKIFAMTGLLRLKPPRALPLITAIARQRLRFKSPGEAPLLSERNAWWTTYEALSTLAQWEGAQALPLLRRKAEEAPAVARLIAGFFWERSLPEIAAWAGGSRLAREKAQEALAADVPLAALRATRPDMLKIVLDPKAPRELRHQLALKLGFCAEEADVKDLLAREEASRDAETRLMLSAALFASRHPLTAPWIEETARRHPDPKTRLGALVQLRSMIPAEKIRPVLEAAARQDPDPENRESAQDMLKALAAP